MRAEKERLAVLAASGVEAAPTRAFDRITALAIAAFEVPTALVTVVDEKRQWFKSRIGFARPETPIEIAFCAHTIRGRDDVVVEDASRDPRFAENELVTGDPRVRFYAGAPVHAPTGEAIGTVAILDTRPRRLDEDEKALLAELARVASAEIALWRPAIGPSAPARVAAAERMRVADLQRERMFATLVRHGFDIITLLDAHARAIEVSPSVERVLGYTPAQYLATSSFDSVHPDDVAHMRDALERLIARPATAIETTYRYRHADGSWRHLDVVAENLLEVEPIRAIVAHARDVTMRVRAEQGMRDRLRQQTALAELGTSVARDARLLEQRAAETIVRVVDSYACMVLRRDDELARLRTVASVPVAHERDVSMPVDGPLSEISTAESVDLHADARFPELAGAGARHAVIAPLRIGARVAGAVVVTGGARFEEGDVQLVVGVANLVAAKLAEQLAREEVAAREKALQLAQKMEALGRLALGIAHDIANVFTGVLVLSESLSESLDRNSQAYSDCAEIAATAQRGAQITRQIVSFAKPKPIHTSTVDVGELVRRVTSFLGRTLGPGIRLDVLVDRDLPAIAADPAQLEQTLLNLCANARDAMQGNGTIHIRVRPDADWVELTVADEGSGMTPDVAARVFEPFFTTKGPEQGTGLGLATVHGIVKEHRGRVRVDTEPGKGARFVVQLPRTDPARADEAAWPHAGRGELVILADDDNAVRKSAATILRSAGYDVLEAVDGIDAQNKFRARAQEIGIVILDGTMPGASGAETLAKMRAERADVPYLFCTGYPVDDPHVLLKPYRAEELLRRVRAALDERPRARAE